MINFSQVAQLFYPLVLGSLDLRNNLFRCSGFLAASKTPSLHSLKQFEAALLKPLRAFLSRQIQYSPRASGEKTSFLSKFDRQVFKYPQPAAASLQSSARGFIYETRVG